jgi:hypothetical protein
MSQMYKKKAQEDPDKYGKNGGQSWTEEEHIQLLKEVNKKSIEEIAEIHKRSKNAISARLKYLARKMINEGKTIEEAQKIVKLVEIDDIQKFISSEKNKLKVKKNNKEILKEIKNCNKQEEEKDKMSELEIRIKEIENKLNFLVEKIKNIT